MKYCKSKVLIMLFVITLVTSMFSQVVLYEPHVTHAEAMAVQLGPEADAAAESLSPDTTFTYVTDYYMLSLREEQYNKKYSYFRFDVSSIEPNIESAKLFVTATESSQPMQVGVYAVDDDSWSETEPGITFNNQPASGERIGTLLLDANDTKTQYSVDLSEYIRSEKASGSKASFVLKSDTTQVQRYIYSKESTVESRRPYLEITYDTNAPVYQSAAVSEDYSQITLTFDESVVDGTNGNLKENIQLSKDGIQFDALTVTDSVYVQEDKLIVTLDTPIEGPSNQVKILADSLKDSYGNVLDAETVTENITGLPDQNIPHYMYASVGADALSISLVFDKNIGWIAGDAASNMNKVQISTDNGITYTPLNELDSLAIVGNTMTIQLASPLTGTENKVKLSANTIKAVSNDKPLDTDLETASLSGRLLNHIIHVSADARVDSGDANVDTNYGTEPSMPLKEGGYAYNRRVFLQFDLSDGIFNNAKLRVYFNNALSSSDPISVHVVEDDTWTETTITYNNQPEYSTVLDTVDVGGTDGWYEWDVTDFIEAQSSDGIASLVLIGSNSSSNRAINSKESGSNGPQLVLNYDESAPQWTEAKVSEENKRIEFLFDEAVHNHKADLSDLKASISLARDGENFAPLDAEDQVTLVGNTLALTLHQRLSESGAKVKLAADSLEDQTGNVLTDELTVDLNYDAAAPVITDVTLDAANKKLTVTAAEALYNNHEDLETLKAAITRSSDGVHFMPLGASDTVYFVGDELVVELENPLEGASNKLKIAANSLKDSSGNVLMSDYTSMDIVTDTEPPEVDNVFTVNLNKKIVIVFNEAVQSALGDAENLKSAVELSRDSGATYQPLNEQDTVKLSSNTLALTLETALEGTNNKIKIQGHTLKDMAGNTKESSIETENIAASDTSYPYAGPSDRTLEKAMVDSGNIVFGNKDAAEGSGIELTQAQAFAEIATAILSGNRQQAYIDRYVSTVKKMITEEANMPNLMGGLDSRGQSLMPYAIALLWNDEEVMSYFSEEEKSKLVTFFKAGLISTAFTLSDVDANGEQIGSQRIAMNGDTNVWNGGNPNYYEPNMTIFHSAAFILGLENIKDILQNYSHMEFIDELEAQGLTAIQKSFEKTTNFGTLDEKAAFVEGIVGSPYWSFRGVSLDEYIANPMTMFQATQSKMWDGIAQDGDYIGQLGMAHEFDSTDAQGSRQNAGYVALGIDPSLVNRVLMHYFGYWDAPGNEGLKTEIENLQKVGVSDYYAKVVNGYHSQSHHGTETQYLTKYQYIVEKMISLGLLKPAVFHDTFNTELSEKWTINGDGWDNQPGSIIPYNTKIPLTNAEGATPTDPNETILTENGNDEALVYTQQQFEDVSVMAWVSFETAGEIGLLGRVQDAENYYKLVYDGSQIAIVKVVDGTGTVLAQKAYSLSSGQAYRLKGVFADEAIELHIDGQLELSTQDSSYTSGAIGLLSNQAQSKFDGILVQYSLTPAPVINHVQIADSSVELELEEVTGAFNYTVKYGAESGIYTNSFTTTSLNPVITGLTNDTPYFITVTATSALGESVNSTEISATPKEPTAVKPILTRVEADGKQFKIYFTTHPKNTSYVIQYGQSSGEYTHTIEDVQDSGYEITLPLSEQAYYFTVIPYNENGFGEASNELSLVNAAELNIQGVSASADDGNIPDNTLDGDLNTRWSAEGVGQWIQFDLGEVKTIDNVSIAFFNGHVRYTLFAIEASTDGTNWSQVYEGQSSGTTVDLEFYEFDPVDASHIRIVGGGNSVNLWNSITEVVILEGLKDTAVGNNGDGDDDGENDGKKDGGSTPAEPSNPTDPEATIVNLSANSEGKVEVSLPNGKNKLLLPAQSNAIQNNNLSIENEKFEVVIDSGVIEALKSLINEEELKDANISFGAEEVTQEDTKELLDKAEEKSNAEIKAAGDVFEFNLSIVHQDGKESKLTTFNKPIQITLKVSQTADKDLVGIYYIADDGTLEFAGGTLIGDKITANVSHFSKYAVLEYNKSFQDVSESFWAYDVIKKMAAKHVIAGVSETEFAPKKQVTRAEFAAFIARALGLEATGEPTAFTDVDSSKWYAEDIAAVYEAGIVSGRDANTFAPNDTITRQEMAMMIVKAYEVKTGRKVTANNEADFADSAGIHVWAQGAVNAAAELELMIGREHNRFVPQGIANRAESSQVIYNLLYKLGQ